MNQPVISTFPRRRVLQALVASPLLGIGRGFAQTNGQLAPQAQAWRAMSRLGYGPSAALVRSVQSAPNAQSWALQQVDAAFVASQQAPRIHAEIADFNGTLPSLFAAFKREREARASRKAQATKEDAGDQAKRMDFSAIRQPEHFSRLVVQQTAAWQLGSCSQSEDENPLLARMTEFWFNHFNVFSGKGPVRPFLGHYLVNVARTHALGKFEDLVLASAHHPAMLFYLDQAQSVADGTQGRQGKSRGLNENYARELMELHTLGVDGGYSQSDVRELARVLTGWTVSPQDGTGFRFAARLHDQGDKLVLGRHLPASPSRRGELEGEDAIRMLARHPSTAKRVSLRLAQFFVADQPSAELVQRLSQTFSATQGDLRAVMRTLLQSPDFWSADNRLFKTPMDYACSALAAIQGANASLLGPEKYRRNLVMTVGFLSNAGQPLHGWQTPDGYKFDAATWLVPEALTRRADYALNLARQTPELDYLAPFLSQATRDAVANEAPAMRTGLMLASPDFMYK